MRAVAAIIWQLVVPRRRIVYSYVVDDVYIVGVADAHVGSSQTQRANINLQHLAVAMAT